MGHKQLKQIIELIRKGRRTLSDVILLIASLGIILLGAELFTNGIEWLGKRLHLGAGAVGSLLAAVGTALPETMVPIIAFISGKGAEEVGIGAILGAPFMLATLAFFISGLAVVIFRKNNKPLLLDPSVMGRDLKFFLIVYSVAILASFLPSHYFKVIVSVFLVAAYVTYVYQTLKTSLGHGEEDDPNPLYLARKSARPGLIIILVQVLGALGVIIAGAHIFVDSVQVVATELGVAVFVLSLIITPIATELPEKFNSVIWLHRRKDTLALGNITGAMVFQSSVIPSIGILMSPWTLEPLATFSALLALGSAGLAYYSIRRRGKLLPVHLLMGGLFYLVFIIAVVVTQ